MDTREAVLRFLPDRVNQRNDLIVTPPRIAEDMINILPDDVWNSSTKFLDPMCKDGIFLYKIYVKLMASESLIAEFPDEMERKDHILHHQLYGVSPERLCQLMTIRTVYGTLNTENNIKLAKSTNISDIRSVIEKEFNGMQFDVVAGNPPYNRGMDLDFVDLGYRISKKYTVMITPAKWQTADDDQRVDSKISYGQFRKMFSKYMSYVCFYPDCKDVFDIGQIDGTTYFLLDKNKNDNECIVENKCKIQKYFNSVQKRSICSRESLNNIGNDVWQHLKSQPAYKHFELQEDPDGRYEIWTNTQMASGSRGGMTSCLLTTNGSSQFIGVSRLRDKYTEARPDSSTAKVVFASNSELEAKSFLSWLDSKFVRFMLAINISKLSNIMCNNFFRFVPAPPSGKFDHIYTDEELYKAFNLPQKYIDVIEAVVKERK